MKRGKIKSSHSKKIFKQTAGAHPKNSVKPMRGGIRF